MKMGVLSIWDNTFYWFPLSKAHPKLEDSLKRLFCMQSKIVEYVSLTRQNVMALRGSWPKLPEIVWLTNKLSPEDYGYETAKKAFHASCSRMGVEYLGQCDFLSL